MCDCNSVMYRYEVLSLLKQNIELILSNSAFIWPVPRVRGAKFTRKIMGAKFARAIVHRFIQMDGVDTRVRQYLCFTVSISHAKLQFIITDFLRSH